MAETLEQLRERTQAENAARSTQDWIDRAREGLVGLRATLREAKRKADVGVLPDDPVTPASATITGAFVDIAKIEQAIAWIELTTLPVQANVER